MQFSQQQLFEYLVALKNHYESLLAEQERSITHATQQLNLLNALLANIVQQQYNQPSVPGVATARENQEASVLTPVTTPASTKIPPETASTREKLLSTQGLEILTPLPIVPTEQLHPLVPLQPKTSNRKEQSIQQTKISASTTVDPKEVATVANGNSPPSAQVSHLKTPLVAPYQHLTKSEAVEKLLQDNAGKSLSIDEIIRSLHGEIAPDLLKAEKMRMSGTLSRGVDKGIWDKLPGATGNYTIDLKLIQPKQANLKTSRKSKAQEQKANTNSASEILPQYQDLNFTEAVAIVVEENAGEILTTEAIAQELYGKLEGSALTKAKDKIGKTLWAGAKQDRWQRVPEKIGAYTWDLEQLSE